METRRVHPLAPGKRLQEGIAAERQILAGIRAQSDMIIDTTTMKGSDLREFLKKPFYH